jgi:hypothetical protein
VGLRHWTRYGRSTAEDRAAEYPCDGCRDRTASAYFRAIGVKASPALTYRWVCQLTRAPYSYDLIDNLGRRSPRELTPGADDIKVGSQFLIFEVTEVEPGRHVSGVAPKKVERVFGPISATYAVVPAGAGSRIVVKMWLGARGPLGRLMRAALAFGDAIMMRKELTTLRDLAERDQRRAGAA